MALAARSGVGERELESQKPAKEGDLRPKSRVKSDVSRDPDECRHELASLDNAHLQNETARDSFLALAHTALFASSIAFYGDVGSTHAVRLAPLLLAAWLSSVTGLIALTWSFTAARADISRRREHLYDRKGTPESKLVAVLNTTALFSFPISLLLTFAFVAANVAL